MTQIVYHPMSRLRDEMKRKRIISFDIFDTLVTRIILTPDAALRVAGRRIENLTSSQSSFFDLRKSAESSARQRHRTLGDITLDEIYDEIGRITGWEPSLVAACRDIEVQTDLATIRPRGRVVALLKEAHRSGKRVLVVSDTYYRRQTVDDLLAQIGVSDDVDEIYVSSQRRARKDTGAIWTMIAQKEDASEILHIGDNLHSDIKKPAERSVQGFHIASGYELFLRSPLHKVLKRRRIEPDDLAHALLLGPLVEELFNDPFVEIDRPYVVPDLKTAGFFLYGPVLMSFLSALLHDNRIMRKKKLLFFAREGYFLIKLYEDVAKSAGLDVPEALYFCCSRLVGLAASAENDLDPDLVLGRPGWFVGTMEQFLKARFGFHGPGLSNLGSIRIQIPPRRLHRPVIWIPFVRRLARFFGKPFPLDRRETVTYLRSIATKLSAMAHKPKLDIMSYAADQGVTAHSSADLAMIDVGYSATIQSSLQRVLMTGFDGFYMATSVQARQVEAQGGSARGAFNGGRGSSSFIARYSLFIEAFLTAPHGQTVGYAAVGPRTEPVFRSPGTPARTMATLEEMFEGVVAYSRRLTEAFGADVFGLIGGSTVALCTIDMLRGGAVTVPAAVVDALQVENLFCGDESRKVALGMGVRAGG